MKPIRPADGFGPHEVTRLRYAGQHRVVLATVWGVRDTCRMHSEREGNQVAAVVTCSDSVAAGRAEDRSGPLAVELLTAAGWHVNAPCVVPDDPDRIVACMRAVRDQGARLIITTGGTGLGPRDVTVTAVEAAGAVVVPGIGEAIRESSRAAVPTADLSRATGFTFDQALVVCLPGSPGGVRDGLAVALPLAPHALAMMDGGGHHAGTTTNPHLPPTHLQPPPQRPASHPLVTEAPIDLAALIDRVGDARVGAVVTFEGRVRNHDHGRDVVELTYSAHPDAPAIFADALARAAEREGVQAVAGAHRVGPLAIGDLAFAVVVSAGHRGAAFDTCAWLVDEVKRVLPVWKLQRFADGTQEWVNCA
ncbi:MAG: hypothetical protein QG597_1086 [Actinomycetota bacterium]|nr:hypothetical protein [Actinomycetota bacterium]